MGGNAPPPAAGGKKAEAVADMGPTSLFLFTPSSPIRRLTTWFCNWPLFEWTVIITIIANCVVMALDDKLPKGDKTVLSIQMEDLEPIFMVVFTIEMCTRILSMGFILHKNSYMRNLWNIMDFVVVTSAFLPMLMPAGSEDSINLNTLRTFRVLRPLKLVSGVPSLQVVMSSIGKAIGPLANIALLLLFAVIIFAIIGLEFYSGALNRSCYSLEDLDEMVFDGENASPCFPGPPQDAPMGAFTCDPLTSVCLEKWTGPNFGITSFDNIGLAMLTVFQCVSMEGWTPILYSTNDAIGNAFNFVFFIPLIVVGSFFMLNLVLGVLSGEFAKEKDRVESRAGFLLLKEEQKLEREMNGYMNWICKAEDLVLAEERTTEKDRKRIMEARRKAAEGRRRVKTEEEELAGAKSEWAASLRRARITIRKLCKMQWWFWTVILMVFLNTCTVAVEHYNQPPWLTEFLFYAEFFFLSAFIFEMMIRLYALGAAAYFSSAFNKFDFFVINCSVFEVFWVNFKERAGSIGFSGLRALRLLRVFKVTKYWSPLRNLVIALMNALSSILSLLFLLFLFIFIFALLGMQLFGGSFNFEDETPTSNFDTVIKALLTVFQVLTEEDWNNVMYTAIVSQGGRNGGGLIFSIYFVVLTLCGNYCLLNVFLAIACDSLDQAAELTAAEEAEKEKAEEEARKLEMEASGIDPNTVDAEGGDGGSQGENPLLEGEEAAIRPILPYSSLFCLGPENPVRVGIHWLVTRSWFDGTVMFVILLSSAALAAEDPVQEKNPRNLILKKFDYGFTAIFGVECLLKVLDLGFMFHPGAYMRDIWNAMDIIVVCCACVSFYFQGTPTGQKLKSVKLLRVLRPLKMVNRVPALKAVFDCVVSSLKNVFNILIVYMLFLLIFAMVGVQLFNGKFFYCNDGSKHNAEECQGEFFVAGEHSSHVPIVEAREWGVKAFNYDNCGIAMITLFAVQTTEGWVDVLQDSMSSTYEDEGPIPMFRVEMAIFYIVYFVVFPFFFVNIFVALVIVTFNELGEAELTGDIDKNQKSCIDYVIHAKPMEVYVPEETTGLRYHIWRLVTSPPFENFIMLLIVLNTLLLMMKYHGAPLEYTDVLADCNLVFTILFTIECVMKLGSFGYKNYFKDSWNTFDFITVIGSIIDATQIVNVGFLRLFRAARLIKLLRRSVSIRILLFTFVQSIKALPYVMMLMMMLFFIYAIVGMQLFGNIKMDSHTAIERHTNFRTIGMAFMLLFRCSTGEAWPELMMACISGRDCDELSFHINETTNLPVDPDKTCGNNVSYAYYVTFIFLCSFIMLNIVVAVIMDSFDYLTRDSSILGSHHLSEFITVWCEYDPLGDGKIHYMDMFALLKQIDPPLGFGSKCPDLLAYKRLVRMNMPVDIEGKVHFKTTLFALVRINLQIFLRSMDEMDQADQELRAAISKIWPFVKRDGSIDIIVPPAEETGPNKLTVGKIFGGMLILENWKLTKFSGMPPRKHLPNGDAIIKIGKAASSMDTNGKLPGGKGLPKTSLAGTPSSINRHKKPLLPPGLMPGENIYENVPLKREGDRKPAPPPGQLPPLPPPKGPLMANGGPGGLPPIPPKNTATGLPYDLQRLRGVSVDRYQEYKTPGYYEDTYYTRATNDGRVTVKHVDPHAPGTGLPPTAAGVPGVVPGTVVAPPPPMPLGGKLERHSSHPNLRPRPATAGGRRLPKTPINPPGTIIVIENVVSKTGRGRTLPEPKRPGTSAALARNTRQPPASGATVATAAGTSTIVNNAAVADQDRRSYSLPRRPPTVDRLGVKASTGPQGTGRRLPPTPQQTAIPLHHAPVSGVTGSRKRELPKPQSLELRHSNRELMNNTNASMGLGGLLGRSSRSMNFPRLEGSPTHSECSSESGFLLSRQRRSNNRSNMLRSNSVTRRKLPDL